MTPEQENAIFERVRKKLAVGPPAEDRFCVLEGNGTFRDLNDEERRLAGLIDEPFYPSPRTARSIRLKSLPGWTLELPE